MKKILTAILLLIVLNVNAQDASGYWYGNANVKDGISANNYLVELIVKQNGANLQAVLNYYFKNTFRSFKLNGTYNSQTRLVTFNNIPLTYFGSNERMEVDCPMDFIAQLRVAKAGSNLVGRFMSKPNYQYICPEVIFDLKLNQDATNQDSILVALREYKETYQLWTPSATDTTVAATILQQPIVNYVVTNQYKQREKFIAEDITVTSDTLSISFYDNGEIDGDSISIFFNDNLLASSQRLSAKAVNMIVVLDSTKEVNEITMFADNLGAIPPNTALMLVYDGKRRYEIRMSSNLQKSATVQFRRRNNP